MKYENIDKSAELIEELRGYEHELYQLNKEGASDFLIIAPVNHRITDRLLINYIIGEENQRLNKEIGRLKQELEAL